MSRIGNAPINVPNGVQVSMNGSELVAKGPKGELSFEVNNQISMEQADNVITFKRANDTKSAKSLHGLTRATVSNMVTGVSEGFKKLLLIEGVGFRAELKKDRLLLTLGFSHPVLVIPPKGIEFKVTSQTSVEVHGADKQLVGEVASKIKQLRKPEPYKGKGIKYEGEYIRRKAGKTAAK